MPSAVRLWCICPSADLSPEPLFLDEEAVLAIYFDIADSIGVGVVSVDENKLGSAVYYPQNKYLYGDPSPTVPELAAYLAYALAKGHAFGDGNKRAALAAMDLFLMQNGYELSADGLDAALKIESMVAEDIDLQGFVAWVAQNCCVNGSHTE